MKTLIALCAILACTQAQAHDPLTDCLHDMSQAAGKPEYTQIKQICDDMAESEAAMDAQLRASLPSQGDMILQGIGLMLDHQTNAMN